MKLIIENVRTFSGRHTIAVKPLTILTGENSSGKTTFLAMYSAVFDQSYPLQPNFNSPPYNLGNFDTIASQTGRARKCVPYFSLGFERDVRSNHPLMKRLEAKYVNYKGQVRLEQFDASADDCDLSLTMEAPQGRSVRGRCIIRKDGKEEILEMSEPLTQNVPIQLPPLINFLLLNSAAKHRSSQDGYAVIESSLVNEAVTRLWAIGSPQEAPLSVAPIRTKPERTYSQITETFKPTGDHVPFLLDQVLQEDSPEQRKLLAALQEFGRESGLFKQFEIKHFRNKAVDPFELMITVSNRPRNLMDVGYGVSQALPVLVQCSLRSSDQTLLLQQPEVHLHPRAQAALGSFFARLAATGAGNLIVETHSDYIIDRVRQEIAAGTVSPDRVALLYFERKSDFAKIHEITIDPNGDLSGAPQDYRQFFLEEDFRLLSRASRAN